MSQHKPQTKTIAGREYSVCKLDPLTAQDVLIDIIQALAPAAPEVAKIAKSMADGDVEGGEDVSFEDASVIGTLAQGLSKAKMRELIATMRRVSQCDGKPLDSVFEAVFLGDLPSMYRWLWFCLAVQFGNFSELARSALSHAQAAGEKFQST